MKHTDHCVVVLGASPKQTRYSNQAVRLLKDKNFRVIPVHPKVKRIEQIPTVPDLDRIDEPVHTLTLYVGAVRLRPMIESIIQLKPERVIFNPGSESRDLENRLADQRIPYSHACTLVLLRTNQFLD